MRNAISQFFALLPLVAGCSSYSATVNLLTPDAGPDAGGATGGAASTGGSSNSAGGTAAGASSTDGTVNTGGSPSTAGSSAAGASTTGGAATGGAAACTTNGDCVNPDPINCSYTCVNPGASGTCKASALIAPTQCATPACDDKATSGFWDAQGKPHIAYGFKETDGTASIRMQQLKLDGSFDGAAVAYRLPTGQQRVEPGPLSANAQGGKVAFLWVGSQDVTNGAPLAVLEFATTDATGATTSSATTLDSSPSGVGVQKLRLDVTPAGAWLALAAVSHTGPTAWNVATGSSIATLSGVSSLFAGEFAFGVLGNTLMLTGSTCAFASQCIQSFVLERFSAISLTEIGTDVTLSQNFQSNEWPAMGAVNGSMTLLWTESQSPGQLFRTLIKEDGTFAHNIDTVQSAISPRAIVESQTGGALLIGVITTGTKYQLVAQLLDSDLGLVGNPLLVADAQSTDVSSIELRPSPDRSQVLITYSQSGARYRLLSTAFCR
jgi:hypothetical protein